MTIADGRNGWTASGLSARLAAHLLDAFSSLCTSNAGPSHVVLNDFPGLLLILRQFGRRVASPFDRNSCSNDGIGVAQFLGNDLDFVLDLSCGVGRS